MLKLKIILVLLLLNVPKLGISQTRFIHPVGGWVEVLPLGQNKYQVDIQMLLAVSGALSNYDTHIERINLDTSVEFTLMDSAGSKLSLPAKFIHGYFFSQKDTTNQTISKKQVLWNNYYKNQFRCTVDLNNSNIKLLLDVNSRYFDFYCNFTSEPFSIYSLIETYNLEKPHESPIAHTRLYLQELTTNERSLVFSNCAFSKFADYNANTYQAVNYYNPGVYGKYGDSVYMELVQPQTSLSVNPYLKNFSATAPAYSYCPDSSNSCTARPNSYPTQGFYFNNQTGDIVFTSMKPAQFIRFAIKAHHFRKNSKGQWRYLGYSILHHGMMTSKSIFLMDKSELTLFPRFIMPTDIKLCEGDSVTSVIKTQVNEPLEKYTATLAGNFPNASVTTDYSSGNSTPTFRLKVVAKKGDNSPTPSIVTLRVHADSNWTRGEAARSVPVYVYKPINPEIEVSTNGCNNLKAVFKGANTDVPVKLTWSLHEKSPSSPAIFTSSAEELVYSGLLPEKYFVKCYVIPQLASCKCSGKTVMDSLDMKKLWPGLDFQLNRNSVCLADSTKVYFPKNMQKFKSNIAYSWEVNGKKVEPNRPDTLAVRLSAGSTIKLTLTDDSGCVMSKSFNLPVDTIYFLQQESFLERCNPDTISLAALSPYSNQIIKGQYSVKNDANEVEFLAEEQIFKYFYNRPKYQVVSTFTSQDGCVSNFTTDIFIDTTQIRVKPLPSLICKGMKTLSLGSLRATPAGGVWSSSQGKDTLISLNIPGKYPHSIAIQYQIESSGCVKTLSDTFQVIDTLKNTLVSVGPVCKETKVWEAPKEFKFSAGGGNGGSGGMDTTSGTWYSPSAGLSISSNGLVYPKKSAAGIYPVYRYNLSTEGCSVQHEGKVEILPPVLNISANISTLMGKPPLVVNFEGLNNTLATTRYTWLFGDKNKAPNDTATGKNVSYTYFDTGKYTPRLIGAVGACRDTLVLTTINVGLMSVESLTQSLRVHLFPNPTELGSGCIVWVQGPAKDRSIAVHNALGKCISVHRLSADQDRLELTAPAAGLYFVEVEGIDKPLKWLVE